MVDICQIACEKHSAAEKSRFERNNQAAAEMIKVFRLLKYLYNDLQKIHGKLRLANNIIITIFWLQETLDKKMDGPFNVVVGEAFTFDIDYVQQTLLYMIFGGYLSVCVWKCV